jgi:hypothetical protein
MLNFNYTLDNELRAPVGQLPSGIQAQALQMALSRMSRKYHQTLRLLTVKVPGTGAAPIAGMTPAWRSRIQAQSAFLKAIPGRLNQMAEGIITEGANAVYQGRLDRRWNTWAPVALKVYGEALRAFQVEVSKAMSNQPIAGQPAAYAKLAAFAKLPEPKLPLVEPTNASLGGYTSDDHAYLGAFDPARANPWWLAGAAALAALWWTSGGGALPLLGAYDDFMDML